MKKIDEQLLTDLGFINLTDEQKSQLIASITRTFSLKIGMRLADEMSVQQLDEFDSISNDPSAVSEWFDKTFPQYDKIAEEELDATVAEIKEAVHQIIINSFCVMLTIFVEFVT